MTRFEHEWEKKLDEKLRALPERRAPAALLSKVMAEAQAREAAKAGLFGRVPGWVGAILLVAAAGAALWVLQLQMGAASSVVSPWMPVVRGLLRALEQVGRAAGAACWAWRLPLFAVAAASLTACASGTVAMGVLVGAGNNSWRTR